MHRLPAACVPLLFLLSVALGAGCNGDSDPGSGTAESLVAEDPYRDAPATRIAFTDVSERAGIDAVNHSGRAGTKEFLLEAVGSGASWFDYDGDGFLDVYIPDGDVLENYDLVSARDPRTNRTRPRLVAHEPREKVFRDQLWRNNGDGTFTDVAETAGIVDERWSFGSTPCDLDADGLTDILVCNFGLNVLWHNNGDGTFTDIAEEMGLQGDAWTWTNAAAVGDMDGDGRLDVYFTCFADPAVEADRARVQKNLPLGTPTHLISGRTCNWKGLKAYCGPIGLKGLFDEIYRQQPDGTFESVTDRWGARPRVGRYGFTALMFDYNEDGLLDVYIANDSVENHMWQQSRARDGRVRLRDMSDMIGIKVGSQINAQASMGMAVADVNQDGLQDIFVTNFSHDFNNLYIAQPAPAGNGVYFKDKGLAAMGQAVYYDLSWGCGWYDFENDGDLDLFVANGHVYKEIDLFEATGTAYDQLNALFETMDARELGLREIGAKGQANVIPGTDPKKLFAGDGMAVARCSRQAAFADFDNDGRMDILVQNMNEPPTLLRNTSKTGPDANWIKLSPAQPGGNHEALGARVEVIAGGTAYVTQVVRQKSFLGCDDPRLHVGVGAATTCDVKVTWPGADRATSEFKGLAVGGHYRLERESGTAKKLALPTFE